MSQQRADGITGPGRMPVAFLPHGGGPWPFVDLGIEDTAGIDALAGYLRSVRDVPKTAPRALLVVSAHWEERVPTVTASANPPLLYDYYGFPRESYQITWPAPGHPQLAARVRELLGSTGFQTAADAERGFDHGTFVPLKLAYPDARVPTVQLSLQRGLDPAVHLAMGRALAPLRGEGVFIIGSGMTICGPSSIPRRSPCRRRSTRGSGRRQRSPQQSGTSGSPRGALPLRRGRPIPVRSISCP